MRRGIPGWLVRLLICVALTQSALNLSRPITSYRALALGADARAIGLITAAYAVLPVLAALPLGRLADRWRPAPLVAAGAVLLAGGSALLGIASSLAALAMSSAVLGLGHLSFMVGGQTLVAQQSEDDQHDRYFGLFTAVTSLGQLVGPALGGLVLTSVTGHSWHRQHRACYSLPGWPSPLSITDGPVNREAASARTVRAGGPDIRLAHPALARRARRDVRESDAAGGRRHRDGIPAGHRRGEWHQPRRHRRTAQPAGGRLDRSRLLVAPMVRTWGKIPLIVVSSAGSAVTAALLPVSATPAVLAALLVVAGFFLGIGQPLTMTLVIQAVPAQVRGAALAMRLTGNRLGQVAVPAAAGIVAGALGVAAAFWLTATLLAAAAWGVARR